MISYLIPAKSPTLSAFCSEYSLSLIFLIKLASYLLPRCTSKPLIIMNNSSGFQRFSPASLMTVILWTALFVALTIGIILSNTLILYYYFIQRNRNCDRPRAHYFLFSLAIMDGLVGIVSVPLFTFFLVLFLHQKLIPNDRLFYQVYNIIDIITGYGSLLTIVCISIDRCGAVLAPIRHRIINRKIYFYSIATTWLISSVVAGISAWTLSTNSYYYIFDYTSGSLFLLAFFAILMSNGVTALRSKAQRPDLRRHYAQYQKLSRAFTIVILVFLVSWIPVQILSYMFVFLPKAMKIIPFYVNYIAKALQYWGSLANCLIYYHSNNEFKNCLRRLFRLQGRSSMYRVSVHYRHYNVSQV